jgi:hypothetical protein
MFMVEEWASQKKKNSCLLADFVLGLLFNPEGGVDMFLLNAVDFHQNTRRSILEDFTTTAVTVSDPVRWIKIT